MRIVSAEEMYKIDKYTVDQIGIREETLMENAGHSTAKFIMERVQRNQRVAILAGSGNNGGDGFVIARILKSNDYFVDLWVIPPLEKIKGAAKYALDVFIRSGFNYYSFGEKEVHLWNTLTIYDVIVDCLLGIGVKGEVRTPFTEIIQKVNGCHAAHIIAIDVPSGTPANGGDVKTAVQADMTITIQQPKLGAFTYPSAGYYGELMVTDIGIPPIAVEQNSHKRMVWTEMEVRKHLPTRPATAHKGSNGKGMIIGGSRQMPGAVMLSASAALRSGAGLITVAIPDEIHSIVASNFLEAMYHPCPSENGHFKGKTYIDLKGLDALAIGPGMGRTNGVKQIVEEVQSKNIPLVIDADALYHLKDLLYLLKNRKSPSILTPHPGEMARLVGMSIHEVEHNRFELSKQFAQEHGVYLVLKGPFTIVTTPEGEQFVNTTGNAALAKGGSGDVLTGMILAFIMQHNHIQAAISNAVFVHGMAADLLVQHDHTHLDVLATDVIDTIPQVLRFM